MKIPLGLDKEQALFAAGYQFIAGIDEAGRGPLAGPVVAACVVLDNNFSLDDDLKLIQDSKKLSAAQREKLFGVIKAKALAVAIGVVGHRKIDEINILQATFLAMRQALDQLEIKPDYVLVDGKFKIPKIITAQEAVINGDSLIFSIAAASIIAKVSRDYLMTEFDKKYPLYNFAQHKGYGTKLHLDQLLAHGPSPIHRRSFAPVKSFFPNKKAWIN